MPPLVPRVSLIVGYLALQCPNLVTTLIQFRLGRPRCVGTTDTLPWCLWSTTGADGHPGAMTARPIAMFPLSTVLFPHMRMPLHVFEPRYRRLVADCLAGDGLFGVVLIARGSEVGGGDQRVGVGTVARIEAAEPLADGRWYLVVVGLGLVRVTRWLEDDPYPRADVEDVAVAESEDSAALVGAEGELRRVQALLSELGDAPAMSGAPSLGATPDEAVWGLCAEAPVTVFDRQRLLEAPGPEARLTLLVELLRVVGDDLRRILAGG